MRENSLPNDRRFLPTESGSQSDISRSQAGRLRDVLSDTSASPLLSRALAFVAGVAALILAYRLFSGIRGLQLGVPIVFSICVLVTALGVRVGSPFALLVATLFGVPLNAPWFFNGARGPLLRAKAGWLARFLRERPRGFNTIGAHVACGAIALKRELKQLCLREEAASSALAKLLKKRNTLIRLRRQLTEQTARLLGAGDRNAIASSRRAHRSSLELDAVEQKVFGLRLDIQRRIVAEFTAQWSELHARGAVGQDAYDHILAEIGQPEGEPEALLPSGLVPGKMAYLFEYGMFFGRAAVTCAFIATFETSSLLWSGALFVLSLYVVEPVVQKLHMSSFNLLLDSPGHKLVDVKRYLETAVPEGGVFRVPITVPKFSSNPAWSNLRVIIDAASERAGTRPAKMTPFALRNGERQTVLEFADDVSEEQLQQARLELETELAGNRARFPLTARVAVAGSKITIELLDELETIWQLVGEDASQAFTYLKRNLDALEDSLTHLGPKFQPVFLFVSNTKDPDVVQFEMNHLAELQAISNERFAGQVGFLYLSHGGQWYNFNAYLERFDATDKDFLRALPEFVRRLAEDDFPGRALLSSLLGSQRSAQDFALAFNHVLGDETFYRHFDGFDFGSLARSLRPTADTLELLEKARDLRPLSAAERRALNRELLLTVMPAKISGDFFKKVGNDIAVHELIVAGKTRPTVYLERSRGEHVQDPSVPNFVRVQGDFARYTGLQGKNETICAAILKGDDIPVAEVPELGAVLDDKNEFGPGELEKGIAIMMHPENRHIVIGVPRINITLPEHNGSTMASDFILAAGSARDCHNAADSRSKACVYGFSSAAYGKWLQRPRPYLAHYAREVLNPAHALSHDFQQSYLVAGAAGRLGGFSEALYGPTRVHAERQSSRAAAWVGAARRHWQRRADEVSPPRRVVEAFLTADTGRGSS